MRGDREVARAARDSSVPAPGEGVHPVRRGVEMNLRDTNPLEDAELLTEENIMTGHEGAMVHCPDPECHSAPILQWVIEKGECYCGEEIAVYLLTEKEVDDL